MPEELNVEQAMAVRRCRLHKLLKRLEMIGIVCGFLGLLVSAALEPLLRNRGAFFGDADSTSIIGLCCSFALLILTFIGPSRARAKIVRESRGAMDNSRTSILLEAYKSQKWFFTITNPPVPTNAGWFKKWLLSSTTSPPANPEAYAIPLRRLLPKIREEDAVYFGTQHHVILRELVLDADPVLAQGAIHAIEILGDERDVEPLDTIASNRSVSDQLRDAAAKASAAIRARIAGNTAQNTLVRMSMPANVSDQLVIPVQTSDESSNSTILLRATDEEHIE